MKVYVLFKPIDGESEEIVNIYKTKAEAEKHSSMWHWIREYEVIPDSKPKSPTTKSSRTKDNSSIDNMFEELNDTLLGE